MHNSLPFVPILSHMNPVRAFPSHFFVLILSTHLSLFLPSRHFPSGFPIKKRCTHFSFTPHVPNEIIKKQEVNICEKNWSAILHHNKIWISTLKFQAYMPTDGTVWNNLLLDDLLQGYNYKDQSNCEASMSKDPVPWYDMTGSFHAVLKLV